MQESLERYAGNDELLVKEHPHRDFAHPERRRAKAPKPAGKK
jgi:hypothetical protein